MDTHISGALTAGSPAVDLRSYCDHASMMRESGDIAQIAPALVRAQAAIENPPRNRQVQVRTQAGTYAFRYATLDKITDVVRPALAENGLCVLQPIIATEKGPALVTRLLHESGQWMECEILLPALGQNPQGFGSAVTYLRRYSISSMLNITADEDDDANGAAGHQVRDLVPVKARVGRANGSSAQGDQDRDAERGAATRSGRGERATSTGTALSPAEAAAGALINQARVAETVEEGHSLLEAWQREAAALESLRGTRAWEALEREMGAGLKRSLGTDPAAAFVSALRAADAAQVAVLQQHWEGRWADTLTAMQQEAPATYALLRRYTAAQVARVRGTPGGPVSSADISPRDRFAMVEDLPRFEAALRDETGEVASDPITDPVAFAQAYANQWHATDEDARSQFARYNIKALAAAAKSAQARTVLDALGGTQGQAKPGNPGTAAGATPSEAAAPASRRTRTAAASERSRKEEPAAPSIWGILRPGKGSITAPDGTAWLRWWKDVAAKAIQQGQVDELRSLYEANTTVWDHIAVGSAEAHDVVADAGAAVREALGN